MNYRHGDVGLTPVTPPPTKGRKKLDHLLLAEGEVTGHFHKVVDASSTFTTRKDGKRYLVKERPANAYIYEQDGKQYLKVKSKATVVHQEHGAIDLPVGTYRNIIQQEWSPEGMRNVLD